MKHFFAPVFLLLLLAPVIYTGGEISGIAQVAAATSPFRADKSLYPSPLNPNFLADGTLVKASNSSQVYYLKGGKKSPIIPSIMSRWLTEAHFFDERNAVVSLAPAELNRYTTTTGVNPTYIGKVLKAPSGTQYYIDDKLRKRELKATIRKALKFPAGNLYPTTASHLQQFATGPALSSTTQQPGGMIIYDGSFHGGRIWRIQEIAGGVLTKREYLTDYFYEAEYYPDENQRVAVSATELARYQRGPAIGTYPSGWITAIGSNKYVVQSGKLRLIASTELFNAMGYKPHHVLTVHQNFIKKIPTSTPIGAYKNIVVANAVAKAQSAATTPAHSTAHLVRVRPPIRTLISQINEIYASVYDKEATPAENQFWADYIFSGEVSTREDFTRALKNAKASGTKPGRTSRTAEIDPDVLKNKWFPYLFYYLWQKEPTEHDRTFWHNRVEQGRNTIEKLDGNMQWLKQSKGVTSE